MMDLKAFDIYQTSDGELTRAYYEELQKRGPLGMIAMNLFRAQKCSARAKRYHGGIPGQGSYRGMAYERKEYSIKLLSSKLASDDGGFGIVFGWKRDPRVVLGGDAAWVLYVDLPTGQVSFHSPVRFEGPDYAGDWDGQHASQDRVLAFCDQVMESDPVEVLAKLPPPAPVNLQPAEKCACVRTNNAKIFGPPRRSCRKCYGSGRVRPCAACAGCGIHDSKICGECSGNGCTAA